MIRVQQGVPQEVHRYREYVSSNCADPERALFSAHAVLDFTFIRLPDAAITNYDLAPGYQQPDMLVDAGSLVVRRQGNGVNVQTTKELAMNRASSGEALSMVACVLGYAETGKDLMFNCARLPDDPDGGDVGIDFPGVAPVAAAQRRGPEAPAGAGRRRGNLEGQVVANIAEQTAATLKECIEQQVAYTKEWAGRVDQDDYTADDLARDTIEVREPADAATARRSWTSA